ncbi:MaoC/PaaZ C-terminal domain-containing protein [Streptomyces sp. NBRC 109706]|uniref:MaoC family dehydratase n=1 Tax=Streptomyces sp. NBRC 109706 TaxID=1550035 RepID=UPI0007810656|nr:MaoC/PaaZ C-terminal domain-containing protein [Streptomyces sp. NBRC 109706]
MPRPGAPLPRPPALPLSYARALLPRRRRPSAVPDRVSGRPAARPEPDRLARYRRLTAFPDPTVLPPCYPHLLAFPLTMALLTARDFPCPPLGLVHTDNLVELMRPLAVDEPLALRVRATSGGPRPGGTAFEVRAEARDADGAVVWRSVSGYLYRQGGGPRERRAPTVNPVAGGERWELPAALGRRYGAVSGDRNPIHLHPLTARPFGFRRPIAHGMWTKARALSALWPTLPAAFAVRVRFLAPVPLPSRPTFAATAEGPYRTFALAAEDGRVQLTGTVAPPPAADPD